MGLDMYIQKRKKLVCPKCGEVVCADILSYDDRQVCYWRKEWWLFDYIAQDVLPDGYGDDMYGAYVPLSIDDLKKIKKKIIDHYTKEVPVDERIPDIRKSGNVEEINRVIKEMKADPTISVVYEADW